MPRPHCRAPIATHKTAARDVPKQGSMPKNNLMAPFVASMFADVNGVPMEPVGAPSGAITDCGGTFMFPLPPMFGYTLTASFWLDLDQAEAASPARLYQPAARGEARGR